MLKTRLVTCNLTFKDPEMPVQNEWWRGGVIYQIYPRSFMDSNGDGIGDLPGITSKLDYVASLGVEAIWISPFFKSPMKDFGYDISDYCDVDPCFGTLDDFRKLLERAHALGLKVMIDQVWSHTSDQHDWFKESRSNRDNPKSDWFVWADSKPDGTAPNNWLSYFGGPAWTWDSRREQYYLHHFLKDQPTLNLWNPTVRQAIKDAAAFWLDMGVDGFRLDAIHTYLSDRSLQDNPVRTTGKTTDMPSSNPMARQIRTNTTNLSENLDWIEELRAFVDRWPDRCLLAEVGGDDSEQAAASYVQTGKRCHLAYSFGLVGTAMSTAEILRPVNRVEELIDDGWFCWAISNHDFKRVASRLKGNAPLADKALFASTLGLSLRGSYCLYEGEELGLPQAELAYEDLVDPYDKMLYPEHVGRDGCRTPMPWTKSAPHAGFSTAKGKTWLPVPPEHQALSVDAQEKDPGSTLNRMRAFLAFRRNNDVLRLGEIEILDAPENVLAFRRTHGNRSMVCVFNSGDRGATIPAALAGGGTLATEISRNASVANDEIALKSYGYAFFED